MASTKVIKLVTGDGEIFDVHEAVAIQLETIKFLLDPSAENYHVSIPLPNVNSKPLALILRFIEKNVEESEERRQFGYELLKDLTNEELLETLLAADYLESLPLLEVLFQAAADRVKNRSVEYIRRFFGVESDFTNEEEENIRRENSWAFDVV